MAWRKELSALLVGSRGTGGKRPVSPRKKFLNQARERNQEKENRVANKANKE